ncbi:hypothetical protein XENOCAPTIV_028825 [Xenoophorus captivus]|uniref:OCEL domain-containing protein n=1 Tax=Xenoophorus captivus TaxID=1517983 RepID=A0ABV0QY27_9TELE
MQSSDSINKHSPSNKRPLLPSPVAHRPLRDRIIHLLALKPYRKPDMLLKLQPPHSNQSRNIKTCFLFLFRKYSTVTTLEQQKQYHDDFCAEYDEYRALHDRIGSITEMFVQLGSKINTLTPGTQEYKVLFVLGVW